MCACTKAELKSEVKSMGIKNEIFKKKISISINIIAHTAMILILMLIF